MFFFLESASDSYKILNLASEDLFEDEWSSQFIFFAFPESNDNAKEKRYYVDSSESYPYHHRVLSDDDVRNIGGNSGWTERAQFWVNIAEQPQTVPFTVLYVSNGKSSYRSQIIEGNNVRVSGWTIHSVFWAYSTPGISVSFLISQMIRLRNIPIKTNK